MDVETISNLISSLGFPIVVCGAMFWLMNKNTETHKEEMEKMTEALNNNTTIITKLYEQFTNGSRS